MRPAVSDPPTSRASASSAALAKRCRVFSLALTALILGGCESLAYYGQSIAGQSELLALRRPIAEVIADPATPPERADKLRQARQMRAFAAAELALPVGGSYQHFADVRREALVWSVVAAPEFSLEPKEWCYLVIGCASYRGYFQQAAAETYAEKLREQGWDVAVEPVPAYSTLGWFDDPLPSTVIGWPAVRLAELLFHELAHRRVYVGGDSAFNEAYATVVAETGVARWLVAHSAPEASAEWADLRSNDRRFDELLEHARAELAAVYASGLSVPEKRRAKAAAFQRLQEEYRSARAQGRLSGYDAWFSRALNNGHLASVATYRHWVPAFEQLLASLDDDLSRFHREVERLAALPPREREARLAAFR